MSLDSSLRSKSTLARHKNVLNRAERIDRLRELEKWADGSKVLGMAKVGNRKAKAAAKVKKEETAATPAAGGAAAPAAPAAAAAPGKK